MRLRVMMLVTGAALRSSTDRYVVLHLRRHWNAGALCSRCSFTLTYTVLLSLLYILFCITSMRREQSFIRRQ